MPNTRRVPPGEYRGRAICGNAQMAARDLKKFCATEPAAEQLLERAKNQAPPERPRLA